MRNLARNVVYDMSLRDTMSCVSSNPTHDLSTVTQKVAVERSQSATRECELRRTVVRENGIGMLQECDQHQPVVDPETINQSIRTQDYTHIKTHHR
jgi:hypothetical protein